LCFKIPFGFIAWKIAYIQEIRRMSISNDAVTPIPIIPSVQDGPFPVESLVAGFWILNVNSLDEAITWANKVPFKKGSVKIRKIAGPEDFGPEFTDALKAQEAELRAKTEQQQGK
jgi:hypothetical protein